MKCKMATDGLCADASNNVHLYIYCDGLPEDIAQCPKWCARSRNEGNHIKEVQ